jgi:pyruvate/2-oxoglutarate dehydrogenase complex dihydrolipoamide acyltransferase (E2) component
MKKSQLLEIIREEIINVLSENGSLEEDLLNETPIYSIDDMAGFQSTLDKFREKGVSKSKALNLLLTKLEDEGEVDTNQLSKDLGVDTATFNNLETRKFLNRPQDQMYTDKTGEELIDFTPYLNVVNKPKGRKLGSTSASKSETAPGAPKAASSAPKTTPKTTPEAPKAAVKTPKAPKAAATAAPKAKESDEEKAAKAASTNKGASKKADRKDELLKDKKAAEDKMRELAKLYSSAEGEEKEMLKKDLKQANADKLKIDAEINRLF